MTIPVLEALALFAMGSLEMSDSAGYTIRSMAINKPTPEVECLPAYTFHDHLTSQSYMSVICFSGWASSTYLHVHLACENIAENWLIEHLYLHCDIAYGFVEIILHLAYTAVRRNQIPPSPSSSISLEAVYHTLRAFWGFVFYFLG